MSSIETLHFRQFVLNATIDLMSNFSYKWYNKTKTILTMSTWKFTTIIGLLSALSITFAMAGEPIIFDNNSKLILPKEGLDPDKLGNNGKFGGGKKAR